MNRIGRIPPTVPVALGIVCLVSGLLMVVAGRAQQTTSTPQRRDLAAMKQQQEAATPAQVLDWL